MCTISVAMTTYNGEKYILDQLISLRDQTQKADEVVIVDDASLDKTAALIADFIKKNELSNWKLVINKTNKGWVQNFYYAISLTTCEIVFFSDQDDIWDKNKIMEMSIRIKEYAHIQVLGCRVKLIDSYGNVLPNNHYSLPFDSKNTRTCRAVNLDNKFIYSISPGCTMAVKRNLINELLEYGSRLAVPHDALFWKIGILRGKTYVLDEPLISYRIHSSNASNPKLNNHDITGSAMRIEENRQLMEEQKKISRIYSLVEIQPNIDTLTVLKKLDGFLLKRNIYLNGEGSSFFYYLKYHDFYRTFRMFLGDLLSRHKI